MKIEIIDNFLNYEDFKELNSVKFKEVENKSIKVYHNSIENNFVKAECLSDNFVKKLHTNYHNKAVELLKKLCPQKLELYDYSEFHIIETGSHGEFPIHDDTPNKLLSGVVYLRPEHNFGTVFYSNKKGDNEHLVEWKLNRAVFFSRSDRETWHSYRGDKKSNRIVLVYNLMTYRLKEVFKIEKKSFFYGMIRYKLNPYLYKLFKKTI